MGLSAAIYTSIIHNRRGLGERAFDRRRRRSRGHQANKLAAVRIRRGSWLGRGRRVFCSTDEMNRMRREMSGVDGRGCSHNNEGKGETDK